MIDTDNKFNKEFFDGCDLAEDIYDFAPEELTLKLYSYQQKDKTYEGDATATLFDMLKETENINEQIGLPSSATFEEYKQAMGDIDMGVKFIFSQSAPENSKWDTLNAEITMYMNTVPIMSRTRTLDNDEVVALENAIADKMGKTYEELFNEKYGAEGYTVNEEVWQAKKAEYAAKFLPNYYSNSHWASAYDLLCDEYGVSTILTPLDNGGYAVGLSTYFDGDDNAELVFDFEMKGNTYADFIDGLTVALDNYDAIEKAKWFAETVGLPYAYEQGRAYFVWEKQTISEFCAAVHDKLTELDIMCFTIRDDLDTFGKEETKMSDMKVTVNDLYDAAISDLSNMIKDISENGSCTLTEGAVPALQKAIDALKYQQSEGKDVPKSYVLSQNSEGMTRILPNPEYPSVYKAVALKDAEQDGITLMPEEDIPYLVKRNLWRNDYIDTVENRQVMSGYVERMAELSKFSEFDASVFEVEDAPPTVEILDADKDIIDAQIDFSYEYDDVIFNRIDKECNVRELLGMPADMTFTEYARIKDEEYQNDDMTWLNCYVTINKDKEVSLLVQTNGVGSFEIDETIKLSGAEKDMFIGLVEQELGVYIDTHFAIENNKNKSDVQARE